MESFHGTTILSVRKNGKSVIAADGQVSFGNCIMKSTAKKLRVMADGKILAGLAKRFVVILGLALLFFMAAGFVQHPFSKIGLTFMKIRREKA